MNKKEAYNKLKKGGHENIVLIEKDANHSFDEHFHSFNIDIIIICEFLEICLSNSNMALSPGSKFKLDTVELHPEKAGPEGVKFLRTRLLP